MHNCVQTTVLFSTPLLKRGIIFGYPCSQARTTDEVEHLWFIVYRCVFLGFLSSSLVIFQSTQRSPTR